MTLTEDLLAEGEPEREFHAGIAARMPRKPVAAAALIRDQAGRVLLIEPVYKPDWVLPGGMVEPDEDPASACTRELREELGVDLVPGRLLVVDWVPRRGIWADSLQFVFDGGRMEPGQLPELVLQEEEVRSVAFLTLGQAAAHLRPSATRRLTQAVAAAGHGDTRYLRFGRPV